MNPQMKLPDAVICLAAGMSQLIVIRKAKELGFAVISVDRNPNAPGFAESDKRINLSTYDSKPILAEIKKLQTRFNIVGVINRSSGPPVITNAEICRALGLPGISIESARCILNKAELLSMCASKKLLTPTCFSLSSIDENDISRIGIPCVIKPSVSLVGKSGVTVVKNKAAIADAFEKAKKASLTGVVNIEEFVPGRDVVLMAIVSEGTVFPITLLDEINGCDEAGVTRGMGFAIPSVMSGAREEELILTLAQRIVDIFGLRTTSFLMSCRCEKGGTPKLIEIHLDLGGDLIFDELIPASTDFDVLGYYLKVLAGQKLQPVKPSFSPTAVLYEKGEGLIRGRSFKIISYDSRESLEEEITRRLNTAGF